MRQCGIIFSMKKLFCHPIIIIFSLFTIFAVGSGVYFYMNRGQAPQVDFIVTKKGDIRQIISVTGRVKPAESVELAFEKSGKVSGVFVKVGEKVNAGEVLITQENSDLAAQLLQAEAGVKAAAAKLDQLKRGSRPEEIKVQEVKISNSEASLQVARRNLADKLEDAYTKSDDAVRNKVDQFFSNPRSASPQLSFVVNNSGLEGEVESGRIAIEKLLLSWNASLGALESASDLDFFSAEALKNLENVKEFLSKVSLAVNGLSANSEHSQTVVDGYRADVSTARANVNTAISNLSAAEEKLKTANSALLLAKEELNLKLAGSSAEDIAAEEAAVDEARANEAGIRAQISKTILRSPIAGVVTNVDAKTGEIAQPGAQLVGVISGDKFEIEANLPEADVAKVKVGDLADITLDAYGSGTLFKAEVISVDPAETVLEGVSTYKTTLRFIEGKEKIRSGMSADADILTASRAGVIYVPQRAVITENGNKYVKVFGENDEVSKKPVKTGINGSEGEVEIIEGLVDGERVVIFEPEK